METVLATIFILNIVDGILHDLVNLSNMAGFFMITRKGYILTLLGSNDGKTFYPVLYSLTKHVPLHQYLSYLHLLHHHLWVQLYFYI